MPPKTARKAHISTRPLRVTDSRSLATHRLLTSIYIIAAISASVGVFYLPDILFVTYEVIVGIPVRNWIPYAIFGNYVSVVVAFVIVLLQGAVLSGMGAVRLSHGHRKRFVTFFSLIALSTVVVLLIASGLILMQTAADAAHDPAALGLAGQLDADQPVNTISNLTFTVTTAFKAILGIWVLWLMLGLIYLRGPNNASRLHRLIQILIASSWIEFGLALPLYLASRDNDKDCPCVLSSYYALLTILISCAILFGPGLYLFYLKERSLCQQDPRRARDILWRKSKVSSSVEIKNESYISNARTMSLIAITLGLLGLELGIFNEQRGAVFVQARKTLLMNYLYGKFHSDEALLAFVNSSSGGIVHDSPFGIIEISKWSSSGSNLPSPVPLTRAPPAPEEAQVEFNATVKATYDSWSLTRFNLSENESEMHRLETLLDELDIKEDLHGSELITALRRKLYNREVKVPMADFWSFNTGAAGWVIAGLTLALLVAVRGALRQITHDSDGGIAEPWLVLDARTIHEHAVAAAWRNSTAWGGWLATFGLILSTESSYIVSQNGGNVVGVMATYVIFVIFLAVNTGTALNILAETRRIRAIRSLFVQGIT